MANLAALFSGGRERGDRAQLILVTAFTLAAIILGLALIINSAIFTENLATRNENVESTEALEFRSDVTSFTGDVIAFANENNHSSHSAIHENVSEGINDSAVYTAREQIEQGAALSLELVDHTNGQRIFQTGGGNFTNNKSQADWELADDAEATRAFELEITDFNQTAGSNFTVVVDDDTNEWTLDINETTVTVTRPDGTARSCDYERTIDVTGATVDGKPCPALEDTEDGTSMQFGAGVSGDYDIEFENADLVEEGNFSLVVAGSGLSTDDADYAEIDGPGDGPYITPAMYSAVLALDYETRRVEYETNVTVAPGEPR